MLAFDDVIAWRSAVSSHVCRARGTPGRSARGAQTGGGPDHRCWSSVDGVDDFGVIDPAQIGGGDPTVGMTQLPLDEDQLGPFAGPLDCMSVAELVRRESSTDAGRPRPRFASVFGSRRESRGGRGWVREAHRNPRQPAAGRGRRAADPAAPRPSGPSQLRGACRPCRGAPTPRRVFRRARSPPRRAPH
jgi:hypothetical protein